MPVDPGLPFDPPGGSWGYLWGLPWASLGVAWGSPAGRLEFFPNSCSQLRVLVGFKESGVVPKSVCGRCRQRPPGSIFHIKTNEKSTFLPRPCPLGAGLVPGPSGSPWGRPGVLLGSSWGAPGVVLGSSWGAPGVVLGPPGVLRGVLRGDRLGFLGVPRLTLGSLGVTLGSPWGSLGIPQVHKHRYRRCRYAYT